MKLKSGKRLTICSEEQNKKKKQRLITPPYLPDELIINDILIRLPARTLALCSCVSKLWYNSIFHDPKFVSSHLVHNKNKLNLVFNLLNAFEKDWKNYFLTIDETTRIRLLADIRCGARNELVGYCNGLACLSDAATDDKRKITIINPTRGETLRFYSNSTPTMGCKYLCHGFGFDSTLQEYKVVFVYTNINPEEEKEFVCMVITLGGDNSWRKIVTSIPRISPPPGSSPFPGRMSTKASTVSRRSATLCGSGLFWRVTNRTSNNNGYEKSDMLLSFDIHNEKIGFIRLPTECCLTHTTATTKIDKHEYLVVDHHILEFQGDLCVARTEKTMVSNSSDRHRNHGCKGSRKGAFCCCGFKVHLYIMNDKVKQVWTKGKTFDLSLKDGLLPHPFCCYLDDTFVTPPTRMLSYSDQLFLYWFNGPYLILYSLQMEHPKVVKCLGSRDERIHCIFDTKRNSADHSQDGPGGNRFFPYMDYQLHGQVENIKPLKNFIPKGSQTCTFSCRPIVWKKEEMSAGVINQGRVDDVHLSAEGYHTL